MTQTHRGRSVAAQATIACIAVAVVAILVVGVLAIQAVTTTATEVAQRTLSDQADVTQTQLTQDQVGARLTNRRLLQVLQAQGIEVVTIGPAGRLGGDVASVAAATAAGVDGVLEGGSTSTTVEQDGRDLLVEARPTDNGGFALVQPVSTTAVADAQLGRRLLVALAAGLLLAVAVGTLLARRLTRPLREVAAQARRIEAGERDVQVAVSSGRGGPPREIADVTDSLNDLTGALRTSESRQRDFLLSVSHELRTPLTAIRGFSESLADGVVTGESVPAVGRTIQRESQRLEQMVDDLLDLARIGADDVRLDLGDVDLAGIATEAAATWRPRCDAAGIPVTTEIAPTPEPVRADPRRLRQVVDLLLDNAVKVAPPGSPVVVAAGPGWVQVRDGGPGLPPDEAAVAFERGALRERHGGSRTGGVGIGLSLAHSLVTRMSGTIEVTTAAEGGAAFTVRLGPGSGGDRDSPTSVEKSPPTR